MYESRTRHCRVLDFMCLEIDEGIVWGASQLGDE